MKLTLKPMCEQVLIITDASSGIGLATATQAAARGARVVLTARHAGDLEQAMETIRRAGGRAIVVEADVADPAQVESVAEAAVAEFGRIDTWVNNAAAPVQGRIVELTIEKMRRQMDLAFWSQVYGSRCAVRQMRRTGGALINVATVSCPATHALEVFTGALRMELEEEGVDRK